MRKVIGISFLFTLLFASQSWGQTALNQNIKDYIEQYKDIAIQEQVLFKVPAAITLAQGILESGAGVSELCTEANNHFGIKCKKGWNGDTYTYDDDEKGECFRKYEKPEDSYGDHSLFLKNNPRYKGLFDLDITDYKGWAKGLQKAGYATNKQYADKLVGYIEAYDLNQYTEQGLTGSSKEIQTHGSFILTSDNGGKEMNNSNQTSQNKQANKESEQTGSYSATLTTWQSHAADSLISVDVYQAKPEDIDYYVPTKKNGLNGFYGKKGDLILEYAINHHIKYSKLLAWNDLTDQPLQRDMFIYTQKKLKSGIYPSYRVLKGMDLNLVSQETGVDLSELRRLNLLNPGENPAPGTYLALQDPPLNKKPPLAGGENIAHDFSNYDNAKQDNSGTEDASNYVEIDHSDDSEIEMTIHNERNAPTLKADDEDMPASKAEEEAENNEIVEAEPAEEMPQDKKEAVADDVAVAASNGDHKKDKKRHKKDKEQKKETADEPQTRLDKVRSMMDEIVYDSGQQEVETPQELQKGNPRAEDKKKVETAKKEQKQKANHQKQVAEADTAGMTPTERLNHYMKNVDTEEDYVREQPAPTTTIQQTATPVKNDAGQNTNSNTKYYTVQNGDTAFSIAKKFGISLDQLKKWNNLPSSMVVQKGSRLKVAP